MLDRVAGLETEYAIRFSPSDGAQRPSNQLVFAALREAIKETVRIQPAADLDRTGGRGPTRFFVENGGSFNYEAIGLALGSGLIEGSTPECRGPGQLLLYQRAQELLLKRALPVAEARLLEEGFEGELGLLKNCRDAFDNVYGAQENYEVDIARGATLAAYRVGLVLLLPWPLFFYLLAYSFAVGAVLFVVLLVGVLLLAIASTFAGKDQECEAFLNRMGGPTEFGVKSKGLEAYAFYLDYLVSAVVFAPHWHLLNLLGFREIRSEAMAFLVTRPLISGAGTVDAQGQYGLSEKGPAIRAPIRIRVRRDARGVIDPGNLIKRVGFFSRNGLRALGRTFHRRQRLQLGLSDSNMAEAAEYLKIGSTMLVLDMVEAGVLGDAPSLKSPVESLHAIVSHPSLKSGVELRNGRLATALEIQRYYFRKAREFVHSSAATPVEAYEIVRLWGEALVALEQDPGTLVGRLDWVTKRFLLEHCCVPPDVDPTSFRKKIDLRYHDLRDGYFAKIQHAKAAPRVLQPRDVAHAVKHPPDNTRAAVRGRWIRELADTTARVAVSWDAIRIRGERAQLPKVVRLDDFR